LKNPRDRKKVIYLRRQVTSKVKRGSWFYRSARVINCKHLRRRSTERRNYATKRNACIKAESLEGDAVRFNDLMNNTEKAKPIIQETELRALLQDESLKVRNLKA
jgi:predicted RNase H-related nuclease YkuK (DUF458 family)